MTRQVDVLLARMEDLTKLWSAENGLADRAAIYAAAQEAGRVFHRHIDEHLGGDPYAHEKASGVAWHLSAMVGFDVTNSHDAQQHAVWALGSLSTLKDLIGEDD